MYENGFAVDVDVERARDLSTRQGTGNCSGRTRLHRGSYAWASSESSTRWSDPPGGAAGSRGGTKASQRADDWRQGDTAMKRLKVSSARRPLADYVADLRDETVLLTEGNRAVAAIV